MGSSSWLCGVLFVYSPSEIKQFLLLVRALCHSRSDLHWIKQDVGHRMKKFRVHLSMKIHKEKIMYAFLLKRLNQVFESLNRDVMSSP